MSRKSNAQKIFESIIILAIVAIAFFVWVFNQILEAIKNNQSIFFYVLYILGFCVIVFAIFKFVKDIKDTKKEKEENNLLLQEFNLKANALIQDIKDWNDNGLEELKTDINLPNEKVFFQHPFKWQNVGGKKEFEGNLYITNIKIRYIDDSAHQLKFDKIMRFTHNQKSFTLFPNNDKSIIFLPSDCNSGLEQMLIVAKFFAIWQIVQGKTLKDFAETFCQILNLTQLKINDEIFYDGNNK